MESKMYIQVQQYNCFFLLFAACFFHLDIYICGFKKFFVK